MKVSSIVMMMLAGVMAAPMAPEVAEKMVDSSVMDAATVQEGVQGSEMAAVDDAATPRQKDVVATNEQATFGFPFTNPLAGLSTIKPSLLSLLIPLLLSPSRPLPGIVPPSLPLPTTLPQLPTTKPGQPVKEGGILKELGEIVNNLTENVSGALSETGSSLGTTLQTLEGGLQDLVTSLFPPKQG